ncbi:MULTISPECIES: hypothetical protein [unclassified Actinoplanes]|uniref:hypothetical protein n=1 Tax=unclassified Actinoplanes TaxID=2626549 RepID=UPI0002DC9E3C|nr:MULTISPECIES: hypothetical protein [unclassified Actinoplanes]
MAITLGIHALADVALVWLGSLVWNAYRQGTLAATEAASVSILAVSAGVGAVITVVLQIGLLRGTNGRHLVQAAMALNLARLLGLLLALMITAARLGITALAGMMETFAAVIAVAEALGALYVTTVVSRRTSDG